MRNFANNIDTKTAIAGVGQYCEFLFGGSLCVVREASGAFDLEFDQWGKATYDAGYTIDTGEDQFTRVRCYNRSAVASLTVSLAIGTGSGKAGVYYDYLRQRATRIVPWNGTFDGSNKVSFPGIATSGTDYSYSGVAAGNRRKHIVISNDHNTYAIIVYKTKNGVDVPCEVIPENSATIIEADDDIKIASDDATPTGHTWYAREHFFI